MWNKDFFLKKAFSFDKAKDNTIRFSHVNSKVDMLYSLTV